MKRSVALIMLVALLMVAAPVAQAGPGHGECTDHQEHDGSPSGEGTEESCQTATEDDDGKEERCKHEEKNPVTGRVRSGVYLWEEEDEDGITGSGWTTITVLCLSGDRYTITSTNANTTCRRETTILAGMPQYSAVCTTGTGPNAVTTRSNCWD